MNGKRKYIIPIVILLVLAVLSAVSTAAADNSVVIFQNEGFARASELKELFLPDSRDWYWNHWDSGLGSATQKTITFNHRGAIRSTKISTKSCVGPRNQHDNKSTGTCNSYTWGCNSSSQCMGYADMIFDLMWEMDPMKGYFIYCDPASDTVGFLDIPGVDYRGCQLYNAGMHHTVILLDTGGSSLKITDCNQEPYCKIRWNVSYKTKKAVSVKGSYFISPTPVVIDDSLCDWESYEVVSATHKIFSGASSKTGLVATITKGTRVYVDATRHWKNIKSENWGYCKTAQGDYGWINLNTKYCTKIEVPEETASAAHAYLAIGDALDGSDYLSGYQISCDILYGEPDIITLDEDGLINAAGPGYALARCADHLGETVDVAITVLTDDDMPSITRTDSDQMNTTVTSDQDGVFRICFDFNSADHVIGKPGAANPRWTSSDESILQVINTSSDGRECTVRAVANGSADVTVYFTSDSGNPYGESRQKLEKTVHLTAVVPESGVLNCAVPAGNIESKLEYLRQAFPDGWYFNSWDDLSANDIQYAVKVDGQSASQLGSMRLGVSNKACDHDQYGTGNCSQYWGNYKGYRGIGYARMMMYLINGRDMETDAFMVPYDPASDSFDFLLSAQPGDIIAAGTNRYYVVQSVSGDLFTVTDCNYDGCCGIRWDAQYTYEEFKNQILAYPEPNNNVYIGRVYMPNYREMPVGNIERYEVVSDDGLEIRSQPYKASNSSVVWTTLPRGTVILADSKYVYSRDAGWALCRTEDGIAHGWALVGDTSLCSKLNDSDDLVFHQNILLPDDWYDVAPFRETIRENRMDSIVSGVFSGIVTSVDLQVKPVHPLTLDTDNAVASWGMSYDTGGERITIDLAQEVSFTEEMIKHLGEGSYLWSVDIEYIQDQQTKTYHQQSVSWLFDEDTVLPNCIHSQSYDISSPANQTFYLTFRDDELPWPTMLYYSVDIIEGDDVGRVLCDTEDAPDYFAVDVIRKKAGTIRFNFTVMGVNLQTITKTFSVTMQPCDHEMTAYWHDYPCTEPGSWTRYCCLCGENLEEGYGALPHHWVVDVCTPATASQNGVIGECWCDHCEYRYGDTDIAVSKNAILFLPEKLKEISQESFMGVSAAQIVIPNGVTKIGSKAFASCENLLVLVVPDSVVSIADDAFSGCEAVICCSSNNQAVIDWAQSHGQPLFVP